MCKQHKARRHFKGVRSKRDPGSRRACLSLFAPMTRGGVVLAQESAPTSRVPTRPPPVIERSHGIGGGRSGSRDQRKPEIPGSNGNNSATCTRTSRYSQQSPFVGLMTIPVRVFLSAEQMARGDMRPHPSQPIRSRNKRSGRCGREIGILTSMIDRRVCPRVVLFAGI